MVTDSVYSNSSCTEHIPMKAFRIQQLQSHQLKLDWYWTNDFRCDILCACEPQGHCAGTLKYDKQDHKFNWNTLNQNFTKPKVYLVSKNTTLIALRWCKTRELRLMKNIIHAERRAACQIKYGSGKSKYKVHKYNCHFVCRRSSAKFQLQKQLLSENFDGFTYVLFNTCLCEGTICNAKCP
jgi:hypothetical protein